MSLFSELKRRNVFKVAAAYLIISWLLIQVSATLVPALYLPAWFNSGVAFLLIIGFPIALIFAWALETTADGIKKEKNIDPSSSIRQTSKQKLNYAIIVLMAVALAYFAWDKFYAAPLEDAKLAQTSPIIKQTSEVEASGKQKPERKSIAVIPFRNRSANEENAEFFSDGVHDELLTNLSRIAELKVISRTSVMSYRDTTKNLRQIGMELGVANILEGGVQRAGDTVRINVQLISAATDEHLWAKSYERKLNTENIFAIQAEIALAIANALEATLTPGEQKLLAKTPTANLEAYDDYLIARQLSERGNWQSLREAQAFLDKAIKLDPKFTQAYVLQARTYFLQIGTGATSLQEVNTAWESAIHTALSLDKNSATAQSAYAQFLWKNDMSGVDAAFEKARQLEPANADIMVMHAQYLRSIFQLDRALQLLQSARELNPVSIGIIFGLAKIHEMRGETDKSLALYAKIRQIDPTSQIGTGPVAGLYMAIGNIVESTKWLTRAMEVDPEDSDLTNWFARAYIDVGDYDRAYQWISWSEKKQNFNPMTLTGYAVLNIYAGNSDTAFEFVRQILDEKLATRWGSEEIAFKTLLIWATDHSQADAALELIRHAHPELLQSTPQVDASNMKQAIDTAHLLQMVGQTEQADNLLTDIIAIYDNPYAVTETWMVTAKAEALALLGDKQAALKELRKQVDIGWRLLWRLHTEFNPNFESLKDDPEFQAIIEFLQVDMARQLQDLRALEAAGEIPFPPADDSQQPE